MILIQTIVTLTSANTEYSATIPQNATNVRIKIRQSSAGGSGAGATLYYYVTSKGAPLNQTTDSFTTIGPSSAIQIPGQLQQAMTVYLQTDTNASIAEVEYYIS